jgi:hypothetical protein
MKALYLLLILLFGFSFLHSQYWGERVTEKSFEESDLYFNSYYLDTYGINRFREVAVGLVNDPFLNLYLNPAMLPDLEQRNLIHLDFRGDRRQAPVVRDYWISPWLDYTSYYRPYIDPRWYQSTRREPEPVFSLGILTYPFGGSLRNVFVGGTYQFIHKQEKFYSMPSWIYMSRLGYDSFGAAVNEDSYYPIKDRYAGKDEMLIDGHLLSTFIGSKINPKLSIGLSLSGVIHKRDGGYLDSRSDEFGQTNYYDWTNYNELGRSQDYHHIDVAAGSDYRISSTLRGGVKIGYLKGKVDQTYFSDYLYTYNYDDPQNPLHQSESYSFSQTNQKWNHNGHNWYAGMDLSKKLRDGNTIKFYYRYISSDVDLDNHSVIMDTSYYDYQWTYDTTYYAYHHHSSLSDNRNGNGTREVGRHQAMVSLHSRLSEKTMLSVGFYYSREISTIQSREPVKADRISESQHWGSYQSSWSYALYEDKILKWHYKSTEWTINIPLFFDFRFGSAWSLGLGLNKILRSWDISEETIAYFNYRHRMENGDNLMETNFGERYREPDQKLSEDFTDVIARTTVNISQRFAVNLVIDPEFESSLRIAQWWLGFQTSL